MENKALLWLNPEKTGTLLIKRKDTGSWTRRYFALQDSNLFFFKESDFSGRSDPAGVIPVQGCKLYNGTDTTVQNEFVIHLSESMLELGIFQRNKYELAASNHQEMNSWIEAIKLASFSKWTLQAKIDYAYMEQHDLERRWIVAKERDAFRASGRGVMPFGSRDSEDPVILQALADDLMEAYHTQQQLQKRMKEAHDRAQEASTYLKLLESAASKQEEAMMTRDDLAHLRSVVQSEMAACGESLEQLIPARFEYFKLERQVEALEGLLEDGEGVPLVSELEAILLKTLETLEDLQLRDGGDQRLPDETILKRLGGTLAKIYEEHMSILSQATKSLQEKPT